MAHKYHAKPVTNDGWRFASTKEGNRYCELKLLAKASVINDLLLQPHFTFTVNGKAVFKYVADFEYIEAGKRIIEDVKGFKTPVYRLKKKLIEAQHGIKITEV